MQDDVLSWSAPMTDAQWLKTETLVRNFFAKEQGLNVIFTGRIVDKTVKGGAKNEQRAEH